MQSIRNRLFCSLRSRRLISTLKKEFFGEEFELTSFWESRFEAINQIGLGNTGSYEWTVLVQKKFASNVKAR